jgi:hypothetical protein
MSRGRSSISRSRESRVIQLPELGQIWQPTGELRIAASDIDLMHGDMYNMSQESHNTQYRKVNLSTVVFVF